MAMVGGFASVISGGKFLNGAVSAAFVHLFNAERGVRRAPKNLTAAKLLYKWLKKKGGEYYFGPNHPMTDALEWSPKLQNAINKWILEYHKIGDSAFLKVDGFFPIGKGMWNLTRQYVGTFTASIYQLDTNKIGVYLYNKTSWASALYHAVPDDFGNSYDLVQHYYFEESY